MVPNMLVYQNFFMSMVFIFQIISYDFWGSQLNLMLRSSFSQYMVLGIFSICLLISLVIHGFLIASFLDTLFKIKKNDASMRTEYETINELGRGLRSMVRYVLLIYEEHYLFQR